MATMPLSIFTALKAAIVGAATLSYVDTVKIRQYRPNVLPNFDHHCIVISPEAATPETYKVGQKWIKYEITLVCLIRVLYEEAYTLEDAIMADTPTSDPPKVGMLAMFEDVFKLLYNNNLGGAIEHYPGLQELDNRCDFKLVGDEEREDFIVEARIYYTPYGQRFISP